MGLSPSIQSELSHDVPAPDDVFFVPEQNGHWVADYDDAKSEDPRLFRIAFQSKKNGYCAHAQRWIDLCNWAFNSGLKGVRVAWDDGTSSMFPF